MTKVFGIDTFSVDATAPLFPWNPKGNPPLPPFSQFPT